MEKKPLKRSDGLKPYSIDHHQGLLLCWKIHTGIKNNVAPGRIAAYVNWFYKNELLPHFELEEKYIFPILGHGNDLVMQAINDHKAISLQVNELNTINSLVQFAELLEKHIRFEERVLFEEVQRVAPPQKLIEIAIFHTTEKFTENTADEFWVN